MLKELGELMGNIIIFLYALTVLNYILIFINKKYGYLIRKNNKLHKFYIKFMKFIVKNHKTFGLLTVLFIIFHFLIEFNIRGLKISGIFVAIIMLAEVLVGIYLSKTTKRKSKWLFVHKIISIVILVAILIHVV